MSPDEHREKTQEGKDTVRPDHPSRITRQIQKDLRSVGNFQNESPEKSQEDHFHQSHNAENKELVV